MAEPLVSIITVSLNSAAHIEQTIRSVLGQDYPRIEYIVVDGGSTDGTVEIIKNYESRIARWVSEPDRGPTEAINKGVRLSSGDIIALLNADDYYADGSVVRRVVEKFKESEAVKMVYGIMDYINPETGRILLRWGKETAPEEIRKRMYLPTPTVFSRREIWEKAGPFKEGYHYADDYEWALRALKITRPVFLDYTITRMRGDTGRSGQNYKKTLAETARALKENGYHAAYARTLVRNFVKIALTELGLKSIIYKVWSRSVSPETRNPEK